MAILVLLSATSSLALTLTLLVLEELSRRLGAVLKTGKSYRWFIVAAIFTGTSFLVRVLSISFPESAFQTDHSAYAALYTIPLTVGVCLGVVIAWRYWGWLVYASDGKTLLADRHR